MPNTYSQIYIQIVFAVEGRQNLIHPEKREELHKYITGIVTRGGQKLIAIFCMPDHVHILIGLKPSIAVSDLVRDIKTGSSRFINEKEWVRGHFNWQEDSARSRIRGARSRQSAITYTVRKLIIEIIRSKANIWVYCENSRWNTMKSISSIFSIGEQDAPTELEISGAYCYRQSAPTEQEAVQRGRDDSSSDHTPSKSAERGDWSALAERGFTQTRQSKRFWNGIKLSY